MARAGDILDNPRAGQRLVFRRTTAETAGALVEVEAIYRPHSVPPLEHFHPAQHEQFDILTGRLRARIDGRERILGAGESVTLAPGVRHLMWNDDDVEARTVWQTRPALRTEAFFEVGFRLACELGDEKGRPPLWLAAQLLHEYRDVFCPCLLPPALQGVLLSGLAHLGRRVGPVLPRP